MKFDRRGAVRDLQFEGMPSSYVPDPELVAQLTRGHYSQALRDTSATPGQLRLQLYVNHPGENAELFRQITGEPPRPGDVYASTMVAFAPGSPPPHPGTHRKPTIAGRKVGLLRSLTLTRPAP